MHIHMHMHLLVQEADAALSIYEQVTDSAQRRSFIRQFESAGSGKGAGSLKFAHTFSKALSHEDRSSVAVQDNLLTRPKILEILGLNLRDFPNQEAALKVLDLACLLACLNHTSNIPSMKWCIHITCTRHLITSLALRIWSCFHLHSLQHLRALSFAVTAASHPA